MEKYLEIIHVEIKSIDIIPEKSEDCKTAIELTPNNNMGYKYTFPFSEKLLGIIARNILKDERGGIKEIVKLLESKPIVIVFFGSLGANKLIAIRDCKGSNILVSEKNWFLIDSEIYVSLTELINDNI